MNSRDPDTLLRVLRDLARELRADNAPVDVDLDSELERDLGIDSLARTELLLRLEKELGRSIPDAAAVRARTARELLAALEPGPADLAARPAPAMALEPGPVDRPWAPPVHAGSLTELVDHHVRLSPRHVHIQVYPDDAAPESITMGQLQAQARRIATALIERGCNPGDRVALMLPTSAGFFYAYAGILFAGCVPVPVYPPFRRDEIEQHLRRERRILENAGARVLVSFAEARAIDRYLRLHLSTLKSVATVDELLQAAPSSGALRRAPDDLALIQYTSGSTGDPKGVALTHGNLLANIRAMGQRVQVSRDDVFVSWLPLYHDMGLIGAWLGSLYFGIKLAVMSPLGFIARPARWLQMIHEHRGTISGAPNFGYELCASRIDEQAVQGLDLSCWRLAFNGAEPVNPDTLDRFIRRFVPLGLKPEAVSPVYGLAECSVGLAFSRLDQAPRIDHVRRQSLAERGRAEPAAPADAAALRFVACGSPLPDHEVRIVDRMGQELGEREEGLLQFRGPSATSGYFNNPQATKTLLADGWLNSGDYAYIAEGEIYITGRAKDIIIRAGRNIYPQELESELAAVEGIRKGCVVAFGVPDAAQGEERLVIVAETRRSQAEELRHIQDQARRITLDVLGVAPDELRLVPPRTILKTSSGKLRRAATRQLYIDGRLGQGAPLWWQVVRLAAGNLPALLRRARRLGGDLAYGLYCYLIFALIVPPSIVLVLLAPGTGRSRAVARLGARALLKLVRARLQVDGLEHLPRDQPHIVAANHASYLDVLLLTAVLPPRYAFVAKRELVDKLIPRLVLSALGTLFVERFEVGEALEDFDRTVRALRAGQPLVFFPEGTFTRQPGLRAFRTGAFKLAVEAGVPLLPLALRGTRSVIRDTQFFARRGALNVKVLPPLVALGTDWEAMVVLRNQTRAAILPHCGEPDLASQGPT